MTELLSKNVNHSSNQNKTKYVIHVLTHGILFSADLFQVCVELQDWWMKKIEKKRLENNRHSYECSNFFSLPVYKITSRPVA